MFVNILSSEEKKAIFQLLLSIARADGNLPKEEIDYLSAYAVEYSIYFDLNIEPNLEQACSQLRSFKSKVVAIQEIVKIALVDGHYDEAEKKGALIIANLLQLPTEKFEEIESWVIEGQKWVLKGEEMLIEK